MSTARHELDWRRLACPMPVIRIQGMLATLAPGDEVVAICSDPSALNDIPAWCRVHGHAVVDCRTDDGEVVVVVKIGSGG